MSQKLKINVDQKMIKKMFQYGSLMIESKYEYINELNVFPVPDGDTGTNMNITTSNAYREIANNSFSNIYELSKSFSRALLMNARGNSGVIFSQIIKGFVSHFKEDKTLLTVQDFKLAFGYARRVAYESVANPVEGTILTVIRLVAEKINEKDFDCICSLFKFALNIAKEALDLTPELLPALKEVGVVDSGGYGLVKFIEGMKIAVCDEQLPKNVNLKENKQSISKSLINHFDVEEGFGYCSEIVLKIGAKIEPADDEKKQFEVKKFKKELEKIGDSLVLVYDDDIVKVHIHTKTPQQLLSIGQKYGEFIKIKIENMTEQFYERLSNEGVEILDDNKFVKQQAAKKLSNKIELIHTVSTIEIANILRDDYGFVNTLINDNGNPSIQEIIELVNDISSSKIIFVTDDSNIVLAAKQAADTIREKIDMRIIPASNIAESLLVSLEFDANLSLDINEKRMKKALKDTTTGMMSRSVKDVDYSHISIHKNDYIGIVDKKIISSSDNQFEAICILIDKLVQDAKSPDVALIFKGKEASEEVVIQLEEYLAMKYEIICEIKEGHQEIYSYIIGLQ